MQAPGLRLDARMVLKPQRMLEQRDLALEAAHQRFG